MGTSPSVIATDPHVVSPRVPPGTNGLAARPGAFKDILQRVPGFQDETAAEPQTGTDSKGRIKRDNSENGGQNDLLGFPVHLNVPFAEQPALPTAFAALKAALGMPDTASDPAVTGNAEAPTPVETPGLILRDGSAFRPTM